MPANMRLLAADLAQLDAHSHGWTQAADTADACRAEAAMAYQRLDTGWHSYARQSVDAQIRIAVVELAHLQRMCEEIAHALNHTATFLRNADLIAATRFAQNTVLDNGQLTRSPGMESEQVGVTAPPSIYPAPPAQLTARNQYDPAITAAFGVNACGLVSTGAAFEALGLPYADTLTWFAKNLAGSGYTAQHGIQPSDFARIVNTAITAQSLPITATIYEGRTDSESIDIMRTALLAGDQVVIDFLAGPANQHTQANPDTAQIVPGTFAHFARVVGFSSDGQTVYLAESLNNADQPVAVATVDLLQAMKQPEQRSEFNGATREAITNWMIVLSRR
jgi:uncharacterized protein YukE